MLSLHTPTTPGVGSNGHFFLLKVVMWSNCADASIFFFIKLSTKTYLTGICYDLNNTEGELRVR